MCRRVVYYISLSSTQSVFMYKVHKKKKNDNDNNNNNVGIPKCIVLCDTAPI